MYEKHRLSSGDVCIICECKNRSPFSIYPFGAFGALGPIGELLGRRDGSGNDSKFPDDSMLMYYVSRA